MKMTRTEIFRNPKNGSQNRTRGPLEKIKNVTFLNGTKGSF
jgi:hypothetical protein